MNLEEEEGEQEVGQRDKEGFLVVVWCYYTLLV